MDDKEKEKFGVIIDKNNQPEGEKPQVEDKPSESSEQKQKDVNENQNLSEDISNNIFMMDPDHTEKMQAAGMNSGDHVDNAIYPRFCLEKGCFLK